MKKYVLSLFICTLILLSGCTNDAQLENTLTDDNILNNVENDEKKEVSHNNQAGNGEVHSNKNELVWVVSDSILPDKGVDEEIYQQFNLLLAEKGFNYSVSFVGYDVYDPELYLNSIIKRKELGEQTDLMITGFGSENIQTNIEAVKHGLLDPLDAFFQTDKGKRLYDQFDEKVWERSKINGIIYGLNNQSSVYVPTYLYIHKELNDHLKLEIPQTIDHLQDLESFLEVVYKETDGVIPLAFWNNIRTLLNYDYFTNGIAVHYDENGLPFAFNPFEDHVTVSYLETFSKYAELNYWKTDDEAWERWDHGQFYATIEPTSFNTYLDGKLYNVTREPIEVIAFKQSDAYIIPNFNNITGIASWSDNKEAAFELLTLVNTDPDLSNLLYYGIEGRHYRLNDGYALSLDVEGRAPGYFSPANQLITYPEGNDPKNKEEYIKEWLDLGRLSPLVGFVLDETEIGDDLVTIQSIYKKYESLWMAEKVDTQLEAVNRELKAAGIDELLEEINRQLRQWWEEKE